MKYLIDLGDGHFITEAKDAGQALQKLSKACAKAISDPMKVKSLGRSQAIPLLKGANDNG